MPSPVFCKEWVMRKKRKGMGFALVLQERRKSGVQEGSVGVGGPFEAQGKEGHNEG